MRAGAVAVLAIAGASCAESPTVRTVSDAELRALPSLSATDGLLVCTALGGDMCPLRSAVANWLGKSRAAVWEPGRPVILLDAESPRGRALGSVGDGAGQYLFPTAVGPFQGGIAVLDLQRLKRIRYTQDGTYDREDNIPRPGANSAPGFIGDIPVMQSIVATPDSGKARMKVDVLDPNGRDEPTRILNEPVGWLRLTSDTAVGSSPLFPASPRYVVDVDRTIIWSPSDSFWVQRRTFDGTPKWTLQSDRQGPSVTQSDINARLDEIRRTAPRDMLRETDLDSMVAHTGPEFPVFSGIVLEPGGRVLLVGPKIAWRDSTQYIVLTPDGTPTHQFALPARTQPLLFAGDSLLVHRPTEGEPWELRWLTLKPTPKPAQ